MKFIYLIALGLIATIVATDTLIHIAILDNNISAFIGLLVGLLVIVYNFIKGTFEKTIFKEFAYSVLIGIAVLIIATSILIALGISKQTSPYLIALLVGIYSFKKISGKNSYITDEKKVNNFLKIRKCPCCQEEISKKYFLKQILFKQGSFSFTEKEKGITCQKCNKPILSAENKHWLSVSPMFISMIPIVILGLTDDMSFIKFIVVFSFSFTIFVVLILKKFNDIDFICNDESSDEFNYHSIHK